MKFIFAFILIFTQTTVFAITPIPSPEITILVSGLGKEGDKFPAELCKFWEVISITQDNNPLDLVPIVKLSRIDLAEEKELILPKNDSWVDNLVKPDPRINLKKTHDFLLESKITKDFSTNSPSDEGQINSRKTKYLSDIPTVFEVTKAENLAKNSFSSVVELLNSLKKNLSNDVATGSVSKYLVLYQLNSEKKHLTEIIKPAENKDQKTPDDKTVIATKTIDDKPVEPSLETKQHVKQGMIFVSMAKQNKTTQAENIKNALVEFDTAVKAEELQGRCYASALMNRGIAYWIDKKLNLAEKDLIKASECNDKDPVIFYNIMSYYSAINKPDLALEPLNKALDLGYKDCENIRNDPDLNNLRKMPDFKRALEHHQLFCLK